MDADLVRAARLDRDLDDAPSSIRREHADTTHRAPACVEVNQCVECTASPCWLRRVVMNRHRHAIEQSSRRWRGGRRGDSARTNLISTQAPASLHDGHALAMDRVAADRFINHKLICIGLRRRPTYNGEV